MKPNIKIPDKILETFAKVDVRTRYYIFAGILVLFFVFDFVFFMVPQMKSLSKITADNKKTHDDLKAAQDQIANLANYKNQVKTLSEQVQKVGMKVKLKEEVPLILERISQLALQNNLKINEIMPAAQDQETILENNERRFSYLPITVDAKGNYHNLGRFLNQVELDDIFLELGTLTISYGVDPRYHSIKMTLKAIISEEVKPKGKK